MPLSLEAYAVPGPPERLTAVQKGNVMTLSWTYKRSETIRGFLIERMSRPENAPSETSPAAAFRKIAQVTGNTYSEVIAFGNIYTYRVRSESTAGALGKPALIQAPALAPPPPPKGFHFDIGNSSVILKWDAEGNWNGRQVFYNVYGRAAASKAGFSLLNAAPLGQDSFSAAPNPGEEMIYQIRALLGGPLVYEGQAASIAVVPEDFVPSRPARPDALAIPGGIRLLWQPNPETWVAGYRVYNEVRGKLKQIGYTAVPTFFDKGAGSGTYRISAVGSVAQGPLSEPVSVIP